MTVSSTQPDRYVSFTGIECDQNSRLFIEMLRRHIDDPDKTNAYWERFKGLIARAEDGTGRDLLYLIHSTLQTIEEYLEEQEDAEALVLLKKIELECC